MKASSMQNHFVVTRSKCRQTKPDIHVQPPSTADNKQVIELKENVAYAPIN